VAAMKKLNRMLFREIKGSKAQFIAAIIVVALGISMFTAALISYRNLKNSKDYYYEQYKFLDYYAAAKAIDMEGINKIKALEGVKSAEGRVSVDASTDMEEAKRVTLRLISLPEGRRPEVNNIYVAKGNYLNSNKDSCLVSKSFAEYYKLEPGNTIKISFNNKKYELFIEGIAESPEYIYEIKSAASPAPSPEEFGIAFIKESKLKEIADTNGLYNEIHITFNNNAEKGQLVRNIEEKLKPYGFIGGALREDQISNAMVSNEIDEMEEIAVMFPALFLTVAAMIIYIMLRRIISNQRAMIGVMKALGYRNKRILLHYILYAFFIALIGSVLGTILGMGLGIALTDMYTEIFSIPVMSLKFYPDLFLVGAALSLIFCLAAGYSSAKRVLKIEPAEAMRSEAPKTGRKIMLENIKFIWNRLSFGNKMSIRNVFRNRKRAVLTAFSTSLTIMFIMVAMFFMDSIDYILDQHFNKFQSQDYKISYSSPETTKVLDKLNSIDGTKKVEPLLEIPYQIKKGGKSEDTLIVGISKVSSMYSLFDMDKNPVPVPGEGILIADRVAENLSLNIGDTVTVKVKLDREIEKDIKVAGIVRQYTGFNCYMNLEELQSLTGAKDKFNGVLLKIDSGKDEEVKKELLKNSNISIIDGRQKTHDNFNKLMEFMYVFFIVMIAFGSLMGFSIVFNTTVINVMERKRELASLKVLGYSKKEIVRTLFKENMLLGIFALVPGLIIGRIMCSVFAKQFSNDFFSIEVYVSPRTYIISILSMFIFIILAQYANRKNIVGLDMIEVLKDREG
jgi:putative ABC transport system permease protein